jgi:hypothetical protein
MDGTLRIAAAFILVATSTVWMAPTCDGGGDQQSADDGGDVAGEGPSGPECDAACTRESEDQFIRCDRTYIHCMDSAASLGDSYVQACANDFNACNEQLIHPCFEGCNSCAIQRIRCGTGCEGDPECQTGCYARFYECNEWDPDCFDRAGAALAACNEACETWPCQDPCSEAYWHAVVDCLPE